MPVEIERKFLVTGNDWQNFPSTYYSQGYLNHDKERTVRVRVAGNNGFLTVKGLTTGATRVEFEYSIPVEEASSLLQLCDGPLVEKNRYLITFKGLTWEVDEFLGDNQGLVVAEVELVSEEQYFERPAWVGEEVTNDCRYYNSSLSQRPFSRWSELYG